MQVDKMLSISLNFILSMYYGQLSVLYKSASERNLYLQLVSDVQFAKHLLYTFESIHFLSFVNYINLYQ